MGTHHCKKPDNYSFFRLISEAVSEFAKVTWSSPNINWIEKDFDEYDYVFFGFLAPTSLSANKIFGAFKVLDILLDSPKLKLVVDGPQMWQYKNSLEAIKRDPEILFTSFYSKRENYETAKNNSTYIKSFVEKLHGNSWPTTIYPELPWKPADSVSELFPSPIKEKLVGVNLDSLVINPEDPFIGKRDQWAVENQKSTWFQGVEKTLSFPRILTKATKTTDDETAKATIRESIGLIVPPQERKVGTWWNYRVIQALNVNTPVATYWPDSVEFHDSWGVLAYQIEDMTPAGRQQLSYSQRLSYVAAIPSRGASIELLKNILIDL